MNVIEGINVDVIEPFPIQEIAKAAQWMHCYKTLMFGDTGPQETSDIEQFLRVRMQMPGYRTWGIIDKDNLTKTKHEAPLVGFIIFERLTAENGYAHMASNRRAWGEKMVQPGLMEQGCRLVIEETFKDPTLQRASLITSANNRAAVSLAKRLGFAKDGYFRSWGRQKGQPVDMIHFGMVKPMAKEEVPNELGQ